MITKQAYAKINLCLDVLRRRPDGYHDVKMIMQTVGIFDVLTFEKKEEAGITLTVDHAEIPADGDNLIVKAARLVLDAYQLKEGVHISLQKNIPIAAGMAGGSTDAAAVFHGLKELFDLPMSVEEMKQLGVKIGADVPYCIEGGTKLSEGIGEVLTPLPAPPKAYLVIAKPDINVSTKFVYENLHANSLTYHPDVDGMIAALKEEDLQGITDRLGNVLETVTVKAYPIIEEIKDLLKEKGALNALMSGSGPTVFGIFADEETAEAAKEAVLKKQLAKQVFVTGFVN